MTTHVARISNRTTRGQDGRRRSSPADRTSQIVCKRNAQPMWLTAAAYHLLRISRLSPTTP